MDKHPQNWFYWLNRNAPAATIIVTVVIALSSAGWTLHTWQKSKASLDISGQVSIGGDVTQVGGDLIITGDPADQKTIGHLNSLLGRYLADLDQRDTELAQKEALIAQLKATLELAQKIAAGGDDQLASRARALLADLEPGSLGAALLPDLRALIQDYEQGPIKDLVELHMGEGALTFYGDPQASLAAYRRAHALDPENIAAIDSIGQLELIFENLKAAEDAFRQVLDLGRFRDDKRAIAAAYSNLGVIAMTRGDFEEAVDYYNQGLALDEELGSKKRMAAHYSLLGVAAFKQDDFDTAVDYFNRALALNKKLGRKEGMALNYAGLGVVAFTRGESLEARQFLVQARGLFAEMGAQPEVALTDQLLADLEPTAGP
ncbi:tetratricopeptide repeat protein [Planktomarina sp.]|jgi:tetratricopeptide (TPR) repeat protein|uniref:tetratricopeptide repeat protein n=1 Tax=Planktomarina sp. TaxID=2024851 RepID=UPI003260BA90|nr:tetratricopeptide repeat protein [Planktomarina temperata]